MTWSIHIEKLFEMHDVRFDMSKRLNIMIGENGIGKTTVLRIISAVLKRDFIELSKYTFARLIIQTENNTLEIKYEDLFPTCDDLEGIYQRNYHEIDDDFEEDFQNLFSCLHKLEKENRYYYASYMSKCYHDLPLSSRLKNFIDKDCYECPRPLFNPLVEILKLLIITKKKLSAGNEMKNNGFTKFVYDYSNQMDALEIPRHVIFANMVDMIPFIDEKIIEPYYYAPALKWIYSRNFNEEEMAKKYKGTALATMYEINEYNDLMETNYFGYFSEQYKNISGTYNALLKSIYENINYDASFEKNSSQKLLLELDYSSQIHINKIINLIYYSNEYIRDVNEIVAKISLAFIGIKNLERVELDRSIFTEILISDIEHYLLPLILKDSIFGNLINQIITNEKGWRSNGDYPKKLIEVFVSFYTENITNIKAACNTRIKVFEELLNSFSTNKTYRIYPSGIEIYTINEHKFKKRNLDLISNDIYQIKLTDLSSGEKKLMLILLEALFLEDGILLIDEPELSFTILWQEELLPTILERTEIENVIVATHSPFIASSDEMHNFLVPLPMEV